MAISSKFLTFLKRAAFLAIACGLPFTTISRAQTSSSSYNPQYNTGPYYTQTYNNHQPPHYTGHSWMDHWVIEGGAGVTPPAGSTQNWANVGWNVLLGTGYKFNDRLSVLAEWNFNDLGVPHSLAHVIAGVPDGSEHLWTADVNPKYNVLRHARTNVYVIGGGGFSRALVNYNAPVVFACFDYYFGPYPCSGYITVAKTSSNQGNIDIGGGGEWHVSQYERGSLFLEARYLHMFTPDNGLPPGGGAVMVPVTFGFRW